MKKSCISAVPSTDLHVPLDLQYKEIVTYRKQDPKTSEKMTIMIHTQFGGNQNTY